MIRTKEQFIKLVVECEKQEPLTIKDYDEIIDNYHKKLGADGVLIALTINWFREDLKDLSLRNRKSKKKLIKWLKSEMRWYNDLGSFDPCVGDMVNRFAVCKRDKLKKESQIETAKK